jgi:hypothetical protein
MDKIPLPLTRVVGVFVRFRAPLHTGKTLHLAWKIIQSGKINISENTYELIKDFN